MCVYILCSACVCNFYSHLTHSMDAYFLRAIKATTTTAQNKMLTQIYFKYKEDEKKKCFPYNNRDAQDARVTHLNIANGLTNELDLYASFLISKCVKFGIIGFISILLSARFISDKDKCSVKFFVD